MRHTLTILAIAAACGGLVSFGMAGDKTASTSPDEKKLEPRAAVSANVDLRAAIHRTMADLIEARSAEKLDPAKIDELTRKLQQLRGTFWGQNAAAASAPAVGWGRPWGCPGMGAGRGAGWGGGHGWGGGPGGGYGRGLGPGAGVGQWPGGPAFADQDHDGVCDYYELRHGMHR